MINIDFNNYLEYLLLYVDSELSPNEAKQVEQFAALHPIVQDELNSLLLCKMPAQLTMFDKQALLKQETNEISMQNYEEKFLLLVDNEISSEENKQIEKFVLQHPEIQKDFSDTLATKLPVTVIEFPNKRSLLKTSKPIVALFNRSLLIAAVTIGLIIFCWNLFNGSNVKNQSQSIALTPASGITTNKEIASPTTTIHIKNTEPAIALNKNYENVKTNAKELNKQNINNSSRGAKKTITQNSEQGLAVNTIANNSSMTTPTSLNNSNTTINQSISNNSMAVINNSTNDHATSNDGQPRLAIAAINNLSKTTEFIDKPIDAAKANVAASFVSNNSSGKRKLKGLFKKLKTLITTNEVEDNNESKKLFIVKI